MDESVFISTPDHVSLEFELAGPGSRFSAYVIDFIFNVLLIVVIFLVPRAAPVGALHGFWRFWYWSFF